MEAKEVWVEPNETVTRGKCKGVATNPKDDDRDGEAGEAPGEDRRHILSPDRAGFYQEQSEVREGHKKTTHHCHT